MDLALRAYSTASPATTIPYTMNHQALHNQSRTTQRSRAAFKKALVVFAVLPLISLSACQKTLLHKDDARSPFDRYNQTRAQHAPPYLEDEYGRRTPNLRDRLVKSEE